MVELSITEVSIDSRVPSARPSPAIAYLLLISIWGIDKSNSAPVAIWIKITTQARKMDTVSLTALEVVLGAQSRECWRALLRRIPALRSHRGA